MTTVIRAWGPPATLGHATGYRVLQHAARFLQRNIREADYVFRLGGDEFLRAT